MRVFRGLRAFQRLVHTHGHAHPQSHQTHAHHTDPKFPEASTTWGSDGKIVPHGGTLVNKFVSGAARENILQKINTVLDLNERQSCDVELLANGSFSPLKGFMNQNEYLNVCEKMRLPGSNLLFGLPVVLDVSEHRDDIKPGQVVGLRYEGRLVAALEVQSRWTPDKTREARLNYLTSSLEHPGTLMLAFERARDYVGGEIFGLNVAKRIFPCESPAEVRGRLPAETDVVAFQCRNPIHRAHYELFVRALDAPNVRPGGIVLVHPTCGPTQADDIPGEIRFRTYEVLKQEVANPRVAWSYLPYSMHMAGPREAIQHSIIRKNFGCTHFIIGRDMAGSKSSFDGKDFYGAYDAQDFARLHGAELGIKYVPSLDLVYTKQKGYVTAEQAKKEHLEVLKISGTEFRKRLRAGEQIPEWFAFASVVKVLRGPTPAAPAKAKATA